MPFSSSFAAKVMSTEIGFSCTTVTMRCVLPRANEIAGIDVANADAAVDRRADGRVIELRLRVLYVRVVLSDVGRVLTDEHPLLIGLFLRSEFMLEELFVAPQIGLGVLELDDRAPLLRLRQLKLGLIGRWVDNDEGIADLDILPFLERHLLKSRRQLGMKC